MSFPRIHPTLSRVSETATRYITAKTPSAEARRIQLHYRHGEAWWRVGTCDSNI